MIPIRDVTRRISRSGDVMAISSSDMKPDARRPDPSDEGIDDTFVLVRGEPDTKV